MRCVDVGRNSTAQVRRRAGNIIRNTVVVLTSRIFCDPDTKSEINEHMNVYEGNVLIGGDRWLHLVKRFPINEWLQKLGFLFRN